MTPAVSLIRHLDEPGDDGAESLGGKGWNLKLLLAAGLPVPPGFCLTSQAHFAARQSPAPGTLDNSTRAAVCESYRRLGGGVVAVRSSATVEDGSAASFAGLQETILGVQGEADLVAAVERCWRSIDSERARLYRTQQQIDETKVAMAVVVQRLVHSDVAGVLFTVDPTDESGQAMLVEASWGLGEAVVSGLLTPDRFHIDRQSGAMLQQQISIKPIKVTAAGQEPVEEALQTRACLNAAQLAALAELGRRVEAYYGESRDIEWAWAERRLWLLQARPITVVGAAERERARLEQVAELRSMAEPRGTIWSKYNLAEVLPAPTPMTWEIVRRFMSGQGGLGLMFRDLGFDPDPIFDELGFIDLVCGRPYVNLSREAKMHFRGFPYVHDFTALKAEPQKALYPQPTPDRSQVNFRFVLQLPKFILKMLRASGRIAAETKTLADRLRSEIYPRFAAAVSADADDWQSLSDVDLLLKWRHWTDATLNKFARESLKPAALAASALGNLEKILTPALGAERAAIEVRSLLGGVRPDGGADLGRALRELAGGSLGREEFLKDFGHRGPQEMELAEPRWREAPGTLPVATPSHAVAEAKSSDARERLSALAREAKLSAAQAKNLEQDLANLQTYMSLRETSKHYFMLGYGMIRRALVEIGRRTGLGADVFYLVPKELARLLAGEDFTALTSQRRRQRKILLSLDVPAVLFSDDLAAIGRPLVISGAAELSGTAVSAGSIEGFALVLDEPAAAADVADGFILVCPSTDPAWVPLFLRAGGLVMETGGILSHGAIVAREFGLPAVVGIATVQRQIRTGQRIRVDGNTGKVHVFD